MSRILIIDDSEAMNELLSDFLVSHGYEVDCAGTAEEGFQIVKRQKPDLILLDIQLPDINGFELCKHFRSHAETRAIPIIMISATATHTQDKVQGLQFGADDYLPKPFEMPELLERIRAVMRRQARGQSEASKLAEEPNLPSQDIAEPIVTAKTFPIPLLFLTTMTILLAGGLAFASGVSMKPLMVCLLAFLLWGFVVSVAVVGSSLMGIDLKWKPGAQLVSVAAWPLLLKLAGGAAMAAWTSLSPFFYTASPALFMPSAPFLACRLDFFEIGALVLLVLRLEKRPGATRTKAITLTLVVWVISAGLLFCVERFGGGA